MSDNQVKDNYKELNEMLRQREKVDNRIDGVLLIAGIILLIVGTILLSLFG